MNNFYHVTFVFKDREQFKAPMSCDDYDTLAQKLRETFTKCLPPKHKGKTFDKDVLLTRLIKQ